MTTSVLALVAGARGWIQDRMDSERGATAVEYGLLVALIAVVIIAAVIFLGHTLSNVFNHTGSTVNSNTGGTIGGTHTPFTS